MSIAGNIKTMPLAELLQWVGSSAKSGTLEIANRQVSKKIFFRGGRIISSSSTDPREYLGHFLVSYGFITDEELTKAIAMQEQSGMLLGKILTTIGAISEDDLHRLLRQKAEEAVYDIFSWQEGDFRFIDGELPAHAMIPMNLEVTAIVLEGAQRLDEWKRIRGIIPSNHCIPVSVGDLTSDPKLPPGARQILEHVNDDRTIEELQLATHSSEYRVSKVLFEQMQKGRLKVVKPRWPTPADGAGTPPSGGPAAGATAPSGGTTTSSGGPATPTASPAAQPPSNQPPSDLDAAYLHQLADQQLAAANFERALRLLRAARALEPDSKKTQEALLRGEEAVSAEIEKSGLSGNSIPKLERSMAELTTLQITPQEGMMLTRINGTYDIKSIVKISNLPAVEALLIFYRLLKAGHISAK